MSVVVYMNYKKIIISILLICILVAVFRGDGNKKEHMTVAVMPNQFIQSNDQNGGNNLDNQMTADFGPDNLNLAQFFDIGNCYGKYYPKSRNVVNDYRSVPLVI